MTAPCRVPMLFRPHAKLPRINESLLRQIVLFACVAALVLPARILAQQPETLSGVLKAHSLPEPPPSIPDLHSSITSYATLDNQREFLIAYYRVAAGNLLGFPILLTRFNKNTNTWEHASLKDVSVAAFPGGRSKISTDCVGSVMSVEHQGRWYYLNLHWNPSAGCVVILNENLTLYDALPGSTAAVFQSGLLVYAGNMVHFADVHPETLYLYDHRTRRSQRLYPQDDDPFRAAFSAALKAAIDPKQCQMNNRSCQPDQFNSTIKFPVEVSDETKSLAFEVSLDPEGFALRDDASENIWDQAQQVYVFRLSPFGWRAFSAYDIKARFGTDSLKELLTAPNLERIFTAPSSVHQESKRASSRQEFRYHGACHPIF
jgi:hypothetical protein